MARDKPLPLNEPCELVGEWWLPSAPDHTASGRLVYDPDSGLRLETIGGAVFHPNDPIPIILGLTVEGRPVTLRKCWVRDWSAHLPGGIRAETHAHEAFVGMHAEHDDDLRLHNLQARVTQLTPWLNEPAIDLTKTVFPRAGTISFQTPSVRALARVGGILASAEFEFVGAAESVHLSHTVDLEQRSWLRLAARRRQHVDRLRDVLGQMRSFIALAAGAEAEILEVRGEATVVIQEMPPVHRYRSRGLVWLLYQPVQPSARLARTASEMLFRRTDATFDNNRPLTRWLRRAQLLRPVYNLYLTGQPRRGLYPEFRFLALIQALETYHARRYRHRGKEPPLAYRLDALVDALPKGIKAHVPSHYVELTRDTRNYFTHWAPRLEGRAAKGVQLFALTEAAKLLLEFTLLLELGFTKTQVKRLAEQNPRIVRDIQRSFLSL